MAKKAQSRSSIDSVGIGADTLKEDELPRLYPVGAIPPGQSVYDCIVYLMYCSVHDCICVTNVENSKVVWLPFVAMPEGSTWEKASLDGVAMLIGKKDQELDAKLCKLPKYQMVNLHILRVQLPNERFIHRLGQFINIEPSEEFKCCEKTSHLEWIQVSEIINNRVALTWGPELYLFTKMLMPPERKMFIFEYSLDNLHNFLGQKGNYQEKLLSKTLSTEKAMFIYEEYIEHCFPAFYMSVESFKCFLIKYGFPRNDTRFQFLFNSVGYSRNGYLDFHELITGLVCMEPTTEQDEARTRFLFRYFDNNCDNLLSLSECTNLLSILNPQATTEQVKEWLGEWRKSLSFDEDKLSFEGFMKGVQLKLVGLKNLSTVARSPKPIIPQIEANVLLRHRIVEEKREERNRNFERRKDRGVCDGCRSQNYEYGQHFLTVDSAGRCIRSAEMKICPNEHEMTSRRYSLEIVFHIDSICNLFVDQFREFCSKGGCGTTFQMAEEAGGRNFDRYIRSLCQYVGDIFVAEEKLMHLNGPAVVAANISGSWESLFHMERIFWPAMPTFTENIIFLGDYIDPASKYNFETVCYLFALKMITPNKLFLLRGNKEQAEKNKFLLTECQRKFGLRMGEQVWEVINDVFNRMPYAIVMDESLLCVHSGIPRSVSRLTKFLGIPEVVKNVGKESLLAWELMSNKPREKTSNESSERLEFNSEMFKNFMKVNRLDFLLRGGESCRDGYRLYFNGQCITLDTNMTDGEAFVALIDAADCDIKMIKMEVVKVTNKDDSPVPKILSKL